MRHEAKKGAEAEKKKMIRRRERTQERGNGCEDTNKKGIVDVFAIVAAKKKGPSDDKECERYVHVCRTKRTRNKRKDDFTHA